MNALIFSLLAAGCASLSSFAFRKNADSAVDSAGSCSPESNPDCSPNGYLVLFYLTSFLLSFLIDSTIWNREVHLVVLGVGACVGILSSSLMLLTAQALRQGPAGLTFAFQNASAIFPGLVLFVLFGSDFGFSLSVTQLLGMTLALFGLFWGAQKASSDTQYSYLKWLKYTLLCFLVQIFALTLIQGRCLLFDCQKIGGIFSQLSVTPLDDVWFMPGQFGASLIMQCIIFFREKKRLHRREMGFGLFGGLANFSSTCFLLLATKFAVPLEKVMIFPCFAIAAMVLCNIWANRIYKEKFNFTTNFLCSFGIFMAVG